MDRPTDEATADGDDRPLGLQRERTLLAWNRTLLALVVATALVVRTIGPPYLRWLHAPAAALGLVVLCLWLAADVRYRRTVARGQVGAPAQLRVLWLAALASGLGGMVAVVAG